MNIFAWVTEKHIKYCDFFLIMTKAQGIQNEHNFFQEWWLFSEIYSSHSFFSINTYTWLELLNTYIFFLYTSLFLHEHICLSSWKTSNTVKFFIIMPKTQGIQNKHNFISRMMIVFRNRFGKHSFFSTNTYTLLIYRSGKLSIGQTLS